MSQAGAGATAGEDVLGRRIAAHVVDFMLLLLIVFVVMIFTVTVHDNVSNDFCDQYAANQCVTVGSQAVVIPTSTMDAFPLLLLGYWTVVGAIEGITGAFVGKRFVGLRVVANEGGRAGVMRGAARGAMMFIDSSACFLIGLATVLLTRPRRRLGDMLARTLVVGIADSSRDTVDSIEWDEHRGVYIHVDPLTRERHIWDTATNQWIRVD